MRRMNKLYIEPKHVLAACVVLCFILIAISFKFEKQVAPVKSVPGVIFTPMQKSISTVGKSISNKFKVFNKLKVVTKENQALKEEIEEIRGENRLLQQQHSELENLRELYNMKGNYSDLPTVAARIISKDPTNWYGTLTMDKGSKDGIKVNMNVIAKDGLVGIVSEVGHNYSKIRTIIDDKSNVTSVFMKSTLTCNVHGDISVMEDGLIGVESVSKDIDVKKGDALYTSYDSPKYHSGILVGYINAIKTDSNNVTQSGTVTPVVDFAKLNTVLVITELSEGLY
ncbi:MAG: rod shape-determining protein MreC [Lachnospiraceae bacterium]|nr:rod shape-determining protein MreC [Lachnospiraceae bacterium]